MSGFLSGSTSLTTVQTADIANDAITLAKLAGGTDGNIISFDASGDPVAIVTGNDGQVLHSAGAGAQPAFETLSAGKVVQVVTANYTTYSTTTTVIPTDDTIPQNDEGTEILTRTITPTNSSSVLYFWVSIGAWGATSTNYPKHAALFKDSTANASVAIVDTDNNDFRQSNSFSFAVAAGGTSEQTWKLRVGPSGATLFINGTSSARSMGGVGEVRMTIMEVAP